MNSTYLESVDKWFGWKGFLSLFAIAAMSIFVGMMGAHLIADILGYLGRWSSQDPDVAFYL